MHSKNIASFHVHEIEAIWIFITFSIKMLYSITL